MIIAMLDMRSRKRGKFEISPDKEAKEAEGELHTVCCKIAVLAI